MNPHQIDAALFAFKSPLSRGALLADEVGLGKTIEAGLVLSQKWTERKRCILVITPSNLRKQWYQELTEKFFLPCRLLETKSFNAAIKQGELLPFESSEIVICSYHFAKNKAAEVRAVSWDLVVIDEAHRLRNVYKPSNVIASMLKFALAGKNKLLLTATPLQNSVLELFGLVSFIDEHTFGDLKSFREQFANLSQEQVFNTLKTRLKPVCHRTPRRPVLPYIKYTQRLPIVEEFTPAESEDRLYHPVSEYLQRDNLQALPAGQRALMTLVLRKLLASSTFAKAAEIGAAQKVVIFTESRRTQNYLLCLLANSPFTDGIVLFNGSNTDERSGEIYKNWYECHRKTNRISGSRTADMRSALVDYFREEGHIMIAIEAGAEGINLQFCSLVVNYDLPGMN